MRRRSKLRGQNRFEERRVDLQRLALKIRILATKLLRVYKQLQSCSSAYVDNCQFRMVHFERCSAGG
jgi:hypothetical protein